MNENSGANTTHTGSGRQDDFEVCPVGTQERLRRLAIIGPQAAGMLEELAEELKNSEGLGDDWPDDPEGSAAQATHDEWIATAAWLRSLCTPDAALAQDDKKEHFMKMKFAGAPAIRAGHLAELGDVKVTVENKGTPIQPVDAQVKFDAEGMTVKIITEDVTRGKLK